MIGNDVVDLALSKKQSRWQRKGFMDKIFTPSEQLRISTSQNPESMVWNLWSRKEAAYKIYNRETGIRGYFPLQLECDCSNQNEGTVHIKGFRYFTKTTVDADCVYTIAVATKEHFDQIKTMDPNTPITKINGIPYQNNPQIQELKPVSITHHGRFWCGITL
ncbi:4'-phosphopantetheinyl transferase family protein [Flavobacterium restrictum]|uniref:4-phosphopantetheinyl transferase family protein n=1 Tax=Flavobacterium restrictum TaxID=2594428 RepID=A0A553ED03_9FLAO|nr:4'-phosphopantetheinyl transferase superfamily protein [Flavobacterium restrictum]TRX42938.1 4-phosphopantetheinyl transferase family protein [Flavobacterium restrictum]